MDETQTIYWKHISWNYLNPGYKRRRVSILVLGPIFTKWNKNWNKFELRLDNFTPIFIPTFGGPKWKRINLLYWNCLFFFPNLNVWVQIGKCLDYVPIFQPNCVKTFLETSNNATWRKGRWTGGGNHVLTACYRVFLGGDRRTKCFDGDRQRSVWCLEQHELRCLRNGRTECALTVSCRRRGKLGCRANLLPFCAAHATSHVSS
jgi:hypothetical protein